MKPTITYKPFASKIVDENGSDPVIETQMATICEVNFDEISDSAMGTGVLQLRVLRDGEYVNFWVNVGVNKQNRVVCEVATNVKDKSVRKIVQAGAWREQR